MTALLVIAVTVPGFAKQHLSNETQNHCAINTLIFAFWILFKCVLFTVTEPTV